MWPIFRIIRDTLVWLANLTGLSYNEINIIVWYMLIPFSWAVLIDKILDAHYLKMGLAVFYVIAYFVIKDFSNFSNKLFDYSVVFLEYFDRVGMGYIAASVVVCVLLPMVVYGWLIWMAWFRG